MQALDNRRIPRATASRESSPKRAIRTLRKIPNLLPLHLKPLKKVFCASLLIGLCSCVEITSHKITDKDTYENVPGTIPYTLPMASFLVTSTYTLGCTYDGTKWTAQITPVYSLSQIALPDPNERYYVNSQDLKSILKDSQLTINLNSNQTLSGVNGTVNDLAGPTIATALGVAAGVGQAAMVGGFHVDDITTSMVLPEVDSSLHTNVAPQLMCGVLLNSDTSNAISQIRELRKKITDRLADPSKPSTTTDPQLGIYLNQISAISTKYLTIKTSYLWTPYPVPPASSPPDEPPTATSGATAIAPPVAAAPVIAAAMSNSAPQVSTVDDEPLIAKRWFLDEATESSIRDSSTLPLKNELQLTLLPWSVKEGAASADQPMGGFIIRNPAVGTLRLCGKKCSASIPQADPTALSLDNSTTVAELDNINIPQFGRRMIVPFRNIMLQNTSIALTLGADGSITSLGTHDMGTSNTVLTTLGTSVQSVDSAITARATAIGASNSAALATGTYADSILKAQADCIAQRNSIIAAGGTPVMQCTSQ